MWNQVWLGLAALTALQPAGAQTPVVERASGYERDAQTARCVLDAAHFHGVNPWLLRAVLKVESDFNARAVHRNGNGTLDVGMAQINSVHFAELARWGVAPASLLDGCVASYVAAWQLARQIRVHGNTWFGVASYHSGSPCHNARYAALLWNTLLSWGAVTGTRVPVASAKVCDSTAPANSRGDPSTSRIAAPALAFDGAP